MFGKTISRYFRYSRPASHWDVVCRHLPLALIAGIPILLALTATLELLPLTPCTFKAVTGFPCPFCGFTRSFQAMAGGDWGFAFYNCPLACVFFVLCVLVFIRNTAGLVLGIKIHGLGQDNKNSISGSWLAIAVCMIFILNWGYRLMEGLK